MKASVVCLLGTYFFLVEKPAPFPPAPAPSQLPRVTPPPSAATASVTHFSTPASRFERSTESAHTPLLNGEPHWANGRVSLPLETMKRLNVSSFKSGSSFELSDDVKSLLHLDAREARAVSALFCKIRDAYRDEALAHPAAVTETERGVIFDLELADPRIADRLREALGGVIDPMRADFLMARAKETFDWEFGGLGRVQKRIEVTILPDNTISVRETLHKPSPDAFGATANAGGERIDPFELAARQYRLNEIPPHLLKYICIDDQTPMP